MARTGAVMATAAFLGVATVAVIWGPGIYPHQKVAPPSNRCTVTTATEQFSMSAERSENAATIAAVGWVYGFGDNGVTVALATAIQESGLRNLDYGDRDSVGLFQQRTSQGWGTVEEILDPRYSAGKFYETLSRVDGWDSLPVTEAAQKVQRSGFPDAYADHEAEARAWALALGGTTGTLSCDLPAPGLTTASDFAARVSLDFPQDGTAVDVLGYEGDATILGIRPADASELVLARLQSWAIATASTTGVEWADVRGSRWQRNGKWVEKAPGEQWADYPGIHVAVRTS